MLLFLLLLSSCFLFLFSLLAFSSCFSLTFSFLFFFVHASLHFLFPSVLSCFPCFLSLPCLQHSQISLFLSQQHDFSQNASLTLQDHKVSLLKPSYIGNFDSLQLPSFFYILQLLMVAISTAQFGVLFQVRYFVFGPFLTIFGSFPISSVFVGFCRCFSLFSPLFRNWVFLSSQATCLGACSQGRSSFFFFFFFFPLLLLH